MYCRQNRGEDFAKFCGLLRIYELYKNIDFLMSEDEIIFQFAGENESAEVIGICSKPQDLGVLSENRNL